MTSAANQAHDVYIWRSSALPTDHFRMIAHRPTV